MDNKPAVIGKKRVFEVKDEQFESHGLKLAGRLVMPKTAGKIPVAVLIHGSERDSAKLFNRLQYLLPANGIGVFVFDKRGTGQSEGRYTQDFQLLSDDAAAAINKAREMAGTQASEVGFQGGSQAGWVIPLASGKTRADFAVVGYGMAESPLAEDREEVFDDLRTAGFGDDVIAKAREITDATGRVMGSRFKSGFDELDTVRAKYRNDPWYSKIKGEFSGELLRVPNWAIRMFGPWFDVGTSWTYDPLPALDAYQAPHLWILAGRDSSAPSQNTLRVLRDLQSTHAKLDVVHFPHRRSRHHRVRNERRCAHRHALFGRLLSAAGRLDFAQRTHRQGQRSDCVPWTRAGMKLERIAAWPAYFMGRRLFRAVAAARCRAAGELRGLHWDQQFFSLNTLGKNVEGSAMLRQLLDADENVQRLQMA